MFGLFSASLQAVIAITGAWQSDLTVGKRPLGVITNVSDDGTLVMKRTNNGSASGLITVRIHDIIYPNNKSELSAIVRYLKPRLTNKEVRLTIYSVEKNYFSCDILATDLKPGSVVGGYLVYLGLAKPKDASAPAMKYAVAHAKKEKLGIWK